MVVYRLPQTFAVVEDEGSILIILVDRTLWLVLGVVKGKEAGGRVGGVSLGIERVRIHGGRDQGKMLR